MSPEASAPEASTTTVVIAPSVDEAIILGLTRLIATRDEVEIEVLDEGSRGFLGIGARESRVQLTRRAPAAAPTLSQPKAAPAIPKPQPAPPSPKPTPAPAELKPKPVRQDDPPAPAPLKPAAPQKADKVTSPAKESSAPAAEPVTPVETTPEPVKKREKSRDSRALDRALVEKTALEVAEKLFAEFNIQYTVSWEQEDRPALWISLQGRDANVMVGPRAQTLNSVQHLLRTLLHRLADGDYNVVLDADGYRKRRRRSLESLARKVADRAVKSGRTVRMKPMPAHERRVIHMLLRKDKRVRTESTGKGRERAIAIIPHKKET